MGVKSAFLKNGSEKGKLFLKMGVKKAKLFSEKKRVKEYHKCIKELHI